jgi:CubicO group peptidase (beta-lactamase class C family)
LLDLDTPVIEWLPELKLASESAREAITLRHLLSHSAGFEGDRFIDYGRGDDALEKAIASFDSLTQWFAPGTFFSYCNAGFYLAGRIIEKVTGKKFEQAMKEEIFVPLGLEHTEIMPEEVLNHPFALGHKVDRRTGVTISRPQHLPRMAHAAGGVISSVGDLLRFARMHMNKGEIDGVRVLSEESVQAMQEIQIEADTFHCSYGIGWHIFNRPAARSIGHGGAWSGHRAFLTIIPERGFAMAMLTNSNVGARAYVEVEEWAMKHYLDISHPKPPRQEMSAEDISVFAGTYLRHDGRYELATHGDGLRLTLTDIDEETGEEEETPRLFDLEPVGETRFRVTSAEAYDATIDILPVPDADGNPRVLLRMGGRVAARVEEEIKAQAQ